MAGPRLNPTLFDKLAADLRVEGAPEEAESDALRPENVRSGLRFYTIPKIERFNEAALRNTVRRELNWLLNTTQFGAAVDLAPYPQVKSSVLNYGVPDMAGKISTPRAVAGRAAELREAITTFEPRLEAALLGVTPHPTPDRDDAITYVIRGDITSAVQAMPVEFVTDIEVDTGVATLRE
jgi:type VI secretion system protein ImpF